MKKIQKQFRQGDVLIQLAQIPAGAQPIKGVFVLAEGELTGHAHRPKHKNRVAGYLHDGTLYLRVKEATEIVHEEHGPISLEPGEYVVRRQVELWLDEVRQVAD